MLAEYPDVRFDGPPNGYTGQYPKRYVAIHNTSNDASDTGEADYAEHRTDKTSSHYYCLTPEMRILHEDLTWRPIDQARVGDRLIGIDEFPPQGKRRLVESTVEFVERRTAECVEIELEDGRTLTGTLDHPWLASRRAGNARRSTRTLRAPGRTFGNKGWVWTEANGLAVGDSLLAPLEPWETDDSRRGGYLAALFDGEGCISNSSRAITFAQREGVVLDASKQMLAEAGYTFAASESRANGVTVVAMSGLQSNLKIMGAVRPLRFDAKRIWLGRTVGSRLYPSAMRIAAIRPVGVREVVSIKTSSRTFFAEGVASHNCDRDSITQSLRTEYGANHAGSPTGNRYAISYEITGTNGKSRSWWLANVAWAVLARQMARDCRKWGIPPVLLTVAQMRDGKTKGFVTHDLMRQAWGGTTHTDPGPNFPMDHLLALVRAELNGEDDDMPYTLAQIQAAPWQYLGRGIANNDADPAGNMSTLAVLDTIYRTTLEIAKRVDISPEELVGIQAAAKAGAEQALAGAVDNIVGGVLDGLDPSNLTLDGVEQALRNVLTHGVAPQVAGS